MATITGKAPVATMQDYVSLVHAYTKGLGHLTLELWGYDECHNPAEVIAQMHYDSEEDFRKRTLKNVISKYFNNSYLSAVSSLVKEEDISLEELKQLIQDVEKGRD